VVNGGRSAERTQAPLAIELESKSLNLPTLVQWMVSEGFTTFNSLDRSAVERYQAFLQRRRGPRLGKISPTTVGGYLLILN
jgi:hypothetical protein